MLTPGDGRDQYGLVKEPGQRSGQQDFYAIQSHNAALTDPLIRRIGDGKAGKKNPPKRVFSYLKFGA
jgi:hypothetical protein